MLIKGVAILCQVISTRWWTAWICRPFRDFVSTWVHPPDKHLASTSPSFVTLQWRLVVLGVVREGTVSRDFRPCPRTSIVIRFEPTSKPPPDVDWTNVHSMSIKLLRIQRACMLTWTKRIQCTFSAHWKCHVNGHLDNVSLRFNITTRKHASSINNELLQSRDSKSI